MTGTEKFRALHGTDAPLLVLPNAWDHASAAALVGAGFAAIGTTSLGVAVAAGIPDAVGATRDETVALARGLARLPALISVDIEGGFSDDPGEVAALAAELAEAGAVGVNIEDGRPDNTLTDVALQCGLIAAIRDAAPDLFVNARTDTHWLPGHTAETAARLAAYRDAGADGLFVPGLRDEAAIAEVVEAHPLPLNVLYSPAGPTPDRLAELGVRRLSTGSYLFRAALHAATEAARAIAQGTHRSPADLLSYADAQALTAPFTP